jgi:large conductance mechanosensitive channel
MNILIANLNDIINELQSFLFKNQVVNLLIAIVVGNAFANLILSSVSDVIFPILKFVLGNPNIAELQLNIGNQTIFYGRTLNLFIVLIVSILILDYVFIKPFKSEVVKNNTEDKKQQIQLIQSVIQQNQPTIY